MFCAVVDLYIILKCDREISFKLKNNLLQMFDTTNTASKIRVVDETTVTLKNHHVRFSDI